MNITKYLIITIAFLVSATLLAKENNRESIAEIEIAHVLAEEPGEIVEVPVYITGMQNFTTFQLYIQFNSDVLLCDMDEGFGVVNIHPVLAQSLLFNVIGDVVMAGRFGSVISIPDGAKLFDLRFKYCAQAEACAENQYTSALTVQEDNSYFAIFQGGFQMIPVNYINGSVSTQIFSLSFNITSAQSENVITDATVSLNGVPNNQGVYLFENLLPASYDYLVQKTGYLDFSGTVFLDQDTTLDVALEKDTETLPLDEELKGITIGHGESFCYNATNSITVGGDEEENFFVVEDGGDALLIAGNRIIMLPGTKIEQGANLHAFITENNEYCDVFHIENKQQSLPENIDLTGTTPLKNVSMSFFKVYPNPAAYNVTLELSGEFTEKYMTIELYSIMGNKLMAIETAVQKQYVISLSDYPPGIYLIRLSVGRGVAHKRIIKR